MRAPRRLLSIAHSYVVALNRRLAHEMARVGGRDWEVTAAAPTFFHGGRDLRPVYLEPLACEPCRLVPVPAYLTRKVHVFFYGRQLRRLLAENWDLVHCWEEPYILAGRQVAWWTARQTPLVFATYQNLSKRFPPPFNWIERQCLRRATGWISGGQTITDALHDRRGYRDRPNRMIAMGVDVDRFQPNPAAGQSVRAELGWDKQGPAVIGYLGRFVHEKGVELLMRALEGVETPWRALFVGTGPLEPALRAWADRHSGRVRVCAEVGHDAVPRHLNAMDVLCAPSQTLPNWREQFGRMLIEAFACGVPVIGSDSGEIPYVIGHAGVVVGEKDEAGWQRVLTELIESPNRRRELAALGLERAHAAFAWPVIARQHLDFFDELLENKARR
jgi:glycosyltransferase involved in cell wall biosynthesis